MTESQTMNEEIDPYLSLSKSYIIVHRATPEKDSIQSLIESVEKEEKEIKRIRKLIEPDYLKNENVNSKNHELIEVRLKSYISESQQEMRNLKRPLEFLENVSVDLVEFSTQLAAPHSNLLQHIDTHVKNLVEEINFIEFRKETLEEFRQKIFILNSNNNKQFDLHSQICKKISAHLSAWDLKTSRQKFAQDPLYKSFRQRIWEASGVDGAMPHLKTYIPAELGDEEEENSEESEEELEITGGKEDYKCPLCLGYLNEAMRSKLCNHTYCKPCFTGYLEQQNQGQNRNLQVSCPNSGCFKKISLNDLFLDESIAVKIRQFRRRQELRQDNQDLFDDEYPNDDENLNNFVQNDDQENKPTRFSSRNQSNSTQRRRRVIVDDD